MANKKIYFLSDLHLGASYFPDSRERETRVVRFLDSIKETASEIYLLGDVLDYWYEYRYVVPRGFVRFFGKIAELSDSGVRITWLIGNHDIWIFDYIPSELGVKVVDGTYITDVAGTRMLMAHGDGVWQHSLNFKLLRALFRNKFCQRLFAAIHPRWTVAFANAWSRHSRLSAIGETPEQQKELKKHNEIQIERHISHLYEYCLDYAEKNPDCRYFIFGHVHKVVERQMPDGREMFILGDWISHFTYAEYDGTTMSVKKFEE